MSYQFYNFLHLLGVILLLVGYGALLARVVLQPENKSVRVLGAVLGGIGLTLLLVSGFGMQAKGSWGWPLWLILKIVVWFLLGVFLSFINRMPEWNKALWAGVIVLAAVSAWLAIFGKSLEALN